MSRASVLLEELKDTDRFEVLLLNPAKNQEEIEMRIKILQDSGVPSAVSGDTPATDIKVQDGHGLKAVKILEKNQIVATIQPQ